MSEKKIDPVLLPDETEILGDPERLAAVAGLAAMVAGLAALLLSDYRTRIKIIKTDV